jgi:hypothetical protein
VVCLDRSDVKSQIERETCVKLEIFLSTLNFSLSTTTPYKHPSHKNFCIIHPQRTYTRTMFKTLGLYRQLRLSHLLVTLLTALILAVCILIGYFWYASTGQVAAWAARDALDDAEYVITRQDDEPLDVDVTQGYITELSWQYVEPERRDGTKGDIPEWYASSWYVILSPKGDVLASNGVKSVSSGQPFANLAAPGFQKSWLEVKGPVRYDGKERLLHWALVGDLHIGFAPIITENNVLLGWIYRRFENESILQFLRGIASTVLYGLLGAAAIAILRRRFWATVWPAGSVRV